MNKICKIDDCGRVFLPKFATASKYSVSYDLNSALVILEKINSCSHHH
ncbi:MAG TPA: hypothetical protein P5530_01625 [Candidatus Diapherotrites archaeon]|nr:hypothetical protein [Candidatus Diapherotrites archaeon]